ncbi:MAG: glycosyltransferase [Alphaproteobacteria bacterium]|nr:glycosyltransferase [Alphaproteobacteria bacterium]
MQKPKISVVINTYNRALVLEETLSSLYYLEYPDFEVIVVNGPSTDNTEEILLKYESDIKIGRTSKRNLSISRNIGIAMAAGDYVAFIDDDAIPDRKWLNKLLKSFNTPEVAGGGGDVFDITGIAYQARRICSDRFGNSFLDYKNNSPVAIPSASSFIAVMGVNNIFRKDILLKIGGFDEQYDYFLDETDLCSRIVDAGYYINYAEGADVYHKFASSNIRDDRKIALDYKSIVKNIIYYCNQYKGITTYSLIEQKINISIDNIKQVLLHHYYNHNLNKMEYQNSLKTIEEGIKLGEESIKRGYRLLINEETLQKYKSEFKKFPNFFNEDFSKKKTIVFITHEYLPITGGTASLVYTSARELVKKGHNVHVITCDEEKYEHPSIEFQENIWVHRVKTRRYDWDFLRQHTPYDIDMDMEDRNIWYLSRLYTLYEELCKIQEKHNISIVHGFLSSAIPLYVLNDEKFNCSMTLITSAIHTFTDHPIYFRLFLQVEKYCVEKCENILGDSNYILSLTRELCPYMPDSKVILLGLPDLTLDENYPQLNNKEKDKIEILFLGRFEERKGIDLLLAVIPEICKDYGNVVFRLAGNNTLVVSSNNHKPYKETFLEEHSNLVSEGKVIFEGRVDDIIPYYKNCDIFVAPSRFESFGLVYVEAMMFAKPTIGTNVSAIPEVVENGITGILFEPENTESLKAAIIKLIENPELRKQMGKAGRKRYEEKFTAEIMANNLLEYYNSIIKDN